MQTSIEKSSDIFQNDEKGRNFYLFINFLRKIYFFLRRAEEKIKREIKKKNKKRNKKEKGSEFPECYRQNIYRTI